MIVRGNLLGVGMFAVGAVVAAIGGFVLKLGDQPTMIAVGLTIFVLDAIVRLRGRDKPGWLFGARSGGFFFFVPIWLVGLIAVAANLLIGAGVIKK